MKTTISELQLTRPSSIDEALALMARQHPPVPLAGCTDVYVSLNFGTLTQRDYLDLSQLPLADITIEGDTLRIGALATYSSIMSSRIVADRLPMLVDAARQVGGVQIQNRGTIGGNIANGSPAGDTLPVLAVSDAVVVLQSVRGMRRVPFTGYYTGYRTSVRQSDELIVSIEIPPVVGRQWFRKVGTRAAQAISKLVVAGVRDEHTRLALGSVAATVMRAYQTEAALDSGQSLEQCSEVLAHEISPIDDIRSTASYRRQVALNLLNRFWQDTD